MTSQEALAQAKAIAMAARFGQLSYAQAKEKCTPYLTIVNTKGTEIAKKYNKRFRPLSFSNLTR